jgi:O-antigen/teichoic acid export membrane protein
MSNSLAASAGSAVRWKTFQIVGVNSIFLARTLVLARLLAPDAFGLVAIATIPVGFLLSITNLGMIPALIQANAPARRHYDVAWTIGLLRAGSTTAIVIVAAPWLAALANAPEATPIMRAMALRPMFAAGASIGIARLNKTLDFRSIARIAFIESIVNAAVSIALAPWLGVWALVFGTVGGTVARTLASYVYAPHRPRLLFDRVAAAALVRFGRWIFVSGVVAAAGNALLRVVVSRRLGVADLGLYVLATQLTFLVVDQVAAVSESVSFPVYATLQAQKARATRFFRATITAVSALLMPSFALLFALAPSLVNNLLGPRWEGTAPLIRVLAVACFIRLFSDAIAPMLNGFGRPYLDASVEVVQTSVLIVLLWEFTGRYGIIGAALAWLPAIAVAQLLSLAFAARLLDRPLAGLGVALSATAAAATTGTAVAWGVNNWLGGVGGLLIASAAGGASTCVLLWLADHRLGTGLRRAVVQMVPQAAAIPWLVDEQSNGA